MVPPWVGRQHRSSVEPSTSHSSEDTETVGTAADFGLDYAPFVFSAFRSTDLALHEFPGQRLPLVPRVALPLGYANGRPLRALRD